jgi:hypothetical protein
MNTQPYPHYLKMLKDRREQIAQDRIIKELQIQELDKEISELQEQDSKKGR